MEDPHGHRQAGVLQQNEAILESASRRSKRAAAVLTQDFHVNSDVEHHNDEDFVDDDDDDTDEQRPRKKSKGSPGSHKAGTARQRVVKNADDPLKSKYRGVTKHRHTGKWEAHLWDPTPKRSDTTESGRKRGRQVYLGGFETELEAVHAYDRAAIVYFKRDAKTNLPVGTYASEMEHLTSMNREEIVAELRRASTGFSRGCSKYRGVTKHHLHGKWEARTGRMAGARYMYLGCFETQLEAAVAYDHAILKHRNRAKVVTNFPVKNYIDPETEKIYDLDHLLTACKSWSNIEEGGRITVKEPKPLDSTSPVVSSGGQSPDVHHGVVTTVNKQGIAPAIHKDTLRRSVGLGGRRSMDVPFGDLNLTLPSYPRPIRTAAKVANVRNSRIAQEAARGVGDPMPIVSKMNPRIGNVNSIAMSGPSGSAENSSPGSVTTAGAAHQFMLSHAERVSDLMSNGTAGMPSMMDLPQFAHPRSPLAPPQQQQQQQQQRNNRLLSTRSWMADFMTFPGSAAADATNVTASMNNQAPNVQGLMSVDLPVLPLNLQPTSGIQLPAGNNMNDTLYHAHSLRALEAAQQQVRRLQNTNAPNTFQPALTLEEAAVRRARQQMEVNQDHFAAFQQGLFISANGQIQPGALLQPLYAPMMVSFPMTVNAMISNADQLQSGDQTNDRVLSFAEAMVSNGMADDMVVPMQQAGIHTAGVWMQSATGNMPIMQQEPPLISMRTMDLPLLPLALRVPSAGIATAAAGAAAAGPQPFATAAAGLLAQDEEYNTILETLNDTPTSLNSSLSLRMSNLLGAHGGNSLAYQTSELYPPEQLHTANQARMQAALSLLGRSSIMMMRGQQQ